MDGIQSRSTLCYRIWTWRYASCKYGQQPTGTGFRTHRAHRDSKFKALILISPVWSGSGKYPLRMLSTLEQPLNQLEVKPICWNDLPIMIIAGSDDRQSSQLFKRLKGARPTSWFKESANGTKEQSERKLSPNQPKTGPLVFEEIRSSLRADKLASLPSGNRTPLQLCAWFISETLSRDD